MDSIDVRSIIMDINHKRLSIKAFEELLPSKRLERLALTYELDATQSIKLSGPLMFLTLLRTILSHQEVSLRLMADDFLDATGVQLHYSTLSKRLSRMTVEYFHDVFDYLAKVLKDEINPKSHGPLSVRIVDATTVTLSAKLCLFAIKSRTNQHGGTHGSIKTIISLEGKMPTFLHLCSTKSELSDNVAIGDTVSSISEPGQLWVFDRGCESRDKLFAIHNTGAFFLTPHHTQGLRVDRVVWESGSSAPPSHIPRCKENDYVITRVEECVFESSAWSSKKFAKMPLAVMRGYRYDWRKREGWKPLDLMTNMPISEDGTMIGPYTFEEVGRLYRNRWQIETFFKKIKGHLSFDHLLNRSQNGIEIMIYMTLIAAMLMIWYRLKTQMTDGWNIVKYWLNLSSIEWIEIVIIRCHRTPLLVRCRGS